MWSLLGCVVSFMTFSIDTVASDESFSRIPLTRCCEFEDKEYEMLEDKCIDVIDSELNQYQQFPEIFTMDGNTTRSLSFPPERFILTHNLSSCPHGYVARKSFSFLFLEDGSLIADEKKLNVGEFCVDQVFVDPDTNPVWVARYCVFDPCLEKPCIRKCCPNGMVIANDMCQPSPDVSFVERLHNESVVAIDTSLSFVSDGVSISTCQYEEKGTDVSPHEYNESFRILADGQLIIENCSLLEHDDGQKNVVLNESYCIDYVQWVNSSKVELILFTCFPPPQKQPWSSVVVSYLLLFSSFFLIATFIVYCLIPEIRNIHGLCVMCHVASLAVTYLGLATIQFSPDVSPGVCVALATIVHFAFLSVFTWLNVISFGIWWAFRDMRPMTGPRSGRPRLGWRMVLYSLYGWTIPALIAVTGFILDKVEDLPENIIRPRFRVSGKCWFNEDKPKLVYLYGPIALFITSNILFFIMTLYTLYRASSGYEYATARDRTKKKCRVIFGLFLLMGISWMWEIISFAVGGDAAHWFFTDVLNILTGVFIFFVFLCKPKIWGLLKLNYPRLEQLDSWCPACLSTGPPPTLASTSEPQNTTAC